MKSPHKSAAFLQKLFAVLVILNLGFSSFSFAFNTLCEDALLRAKASLQPIQEWMPKLKTLKKDLVLVGLGPYAKHTYFPLLQEYFGFTPRLIIELKSHQKEVEAFLKYRKAKAKVLYIEDAVKDEDELSVQDQKRLSAALQREAITHAIISTEPKSHLAYLKFFTDKNIHCLTDKPLTAPRNSSVVAEQALKIKQDYQDLLTTLEGSESRVGIQVQKRYHPGYLFARGLIESVAEKFKIPPTSIQISSSDGNWILPTEVMRENHPVRYGYGKLLFSGYHFVDLMEWFRSAADPYLEESKQATSGLVQSMSVFPSDAFKVSDEKLLNQSFPDYAQHVIPEADLSQFGELDIYAQVAFKNRQSNTITVGKLDLVSQGVSGRDKAETAQDPYRGMGRKGHEDMTIHLGGIMTIHLRSYTDYESKAFSDAPGSRNHFEVLVFQNSALTQGPSVSTYSMSDLNHALDLNEPVHSQGDEARLRSLIDFLSGLNQHSEIHSHAHGIEILKSICLSSANCSRVGFDF